MNNILRKTYAANPRNSVTNLWHVPYIYSYKINCILLCMQDIYTWPSHFMHTCSPHLIRRGTSHWTPLHLHHLCWQNSGRHRHGLVGSWGTATEWVSGWLKRLSLSVLCSPGPHHWSPPCPCRRTRWRHHLCEWSCSWCWRQLQCWGCSELSQWVQGCLTALQQVVPNQVSKWGLSKGIHRQIYAWSIDQRNSNSDDKYKKMKIIWKTCQYTCIYIHVYNM